MKRPTWQSGECRGWGALLLAVDLGGGRVGNREMLAPLRDGQHRNLWKWIGWWGGGGQAKRPGKRQQRGLETDLTLQVRACGMCEWNTDLGQAFPISL